MRKTFLISLTLLGALAATAVCQAQAAPCCGLGDVNFDNVVDSRDQALIRDFVFGIQMPSPQQEFYADLNGDGCLSTFDNILIQKFIRGQVETFPQCGDLDADGFLEYGFRDVDGDGVRDRDDENIMKAILRNPGASYDETLLINADADGDCAVEASDRILFWLHEAGHIQSFGGCAYDPTPCRPTPDCENP